LKPPSTLTHSQHRQDAIDVDAVAGERQQQAFETHRLALAVGDLADGVDRAAAHRGLPVGRQGRVSQQRRKFVIEELIVAFAVSLVDAGAAEPDEESQRALSSTMSQNCMLSTIRDNSSTSRVFHNGARWSRRSRCQ
jgi:hypothetical protein